MSAKLLHSLVDEKPGSREQIGSMTGRYQRSSSKCSVTGGRVSLKRLPSVYTDFSSSDNRHNLNLNLQALYTRRDADDNRRASMESSRASSACSSSISSLDRIVLPEASSWHPLKNWSGTQFQDKFDGSERDIKGPADIKESLRVLARLRESPSQLSYEAAYHAPRLSYDGREPSRVSSATQETIMRVKDLPRLSLDSKEHTILDSDSSLKQGLQSNGFLENSRNLKGQMNTARLSASQKRPTSVVAKLMGLEALPDPVRPIGTSDSARRPTTEAKSPTWKHHDSAMKSIRGPRFPIEPAPWKLHSCGNEEFQKSSGSKAMKVSTRQEEPLSFGYGEIEKRLKDSEFEPSGKDLRALKRILEAMRAKGFLESDRGEECQTNSGSLKQYDIKYMSPHQNLKLANDCRPRNNHPFPSVEQEPDYFRDIEPTIVIMKPAKLVGRDCVGTAIAKDRSKLSRKDPLGYIDKRSNTQGLNSKERSASPVKSSSSPRPQQKKLEQEKQDHSIRQPHEQKITSLRSDLPDFSSTSGCNTFRESETRNEINYQSLSLKPWRHLNTGPVQKPQRLREEDGPPSEEAVSVLMQHSSPVSVLDLPESPDDSQSPVKQTQKSPGDYSGQEHDVEYEGGSSLEIINRKKLRNVERLVQKLKRLNSTHDEESNDYIALLCENSNPDHRYISEILVSSGFLLQDLSSGLSAFQLHSSGHPINPDLFIVLEHRKTRNGVVTKEEKSHRRLTFDAVNEILGKKYADPGILQDKLVEETLTAQKLLKELCCEIELLEAKTKKPRSGSEDEVAGCLRSILWEDVMRGEDKWTGSCGAAYDVVKALEDMILQELVDEIGIGGKVGLKTSSIRQSQQAACRTTRCFRVLLCHLPVRDSMYYYSFIQSITISSSSRTWIDNISDCSGENTYMLPQGDTFRPEMSMQDSEMLG